MTDIIVKDFRDYLPPETGYTIVNGDVLVLDKDRNLIYSYNINELKGGTESIHLWDSPDPEYPTGYPLDFIVEYSGKLWKSLITDNNNNPPSDGSDKWDEVSKSEANGFGVWSAGVFTVNPTLVTVVDSLYKLADSVTLPFESTDFAAEFTAGQWVSLGGNVFDSIILNPQATPPAHQAGELFYDSVADQFAGFTSDPLIGTTLLGEQLMFTAINEESFGLVAGDIVKITGLATTKPSIEGAQANTIIDARTTLGMVKAPIAAGEMGKVGVFDIVSGVDTSGMDINDIIYLDPFNARKFTNVEPLPPNYTLAVGFVSVVDDTNGVVGIRFGGYSGSDTGVNIQGTLNGLVTQTPDVQFSVSGGIIYADVINESFPSLDLPFLIGGDRYLLNTTTNTGAGGAARIIIPPGNPPSSGDGGQKSWVYVTLNAGVPELGVSTSKPSVPNCGICTVVAFDAATTLARGEKPQAYRRENNASNSETEGIEGSYGLTRVQLDDARSRGSAWDSGQDPTPTVNDTTIQLAMTAGIGKQLHYTNLPIFDGLLYQVYNDITNAITYQDETNLVNIVTDASGDTLLGNGFFYALKFYYKLNSNGLGNDVIVTRPKGHYSTGALAESDALSYTTDFADTNIEDLVYPVYEMIIERSGTGGGLGLTINLYSIKSLRSKTPGAGGGSGGEGVATDDKIRISASDTTNDYANAKFLVGDEFTNEIVNPGGNENFLLKFKGWIYNAGRTFYTNITSLATQAREILIPDKDGTILLEGDEAAYKFLYKDLSLADPAVIPGTGFKFNVVNIDGKIDDSTVLYVSASHLPAANAATGSNLFVGDLKAGASITLSAFPNATDGVGGRCEVKLTGDPVLYALNTYAIPITVITGMDEPSIDSEYWLGFHQAPVDPKTGAFYKFLYNRDTVSADPDAFKFSLNTNNPSTATMLNISQFHFNPSGNNNYSANSFVKELAIGARINCEVMGFYDEENWTEFEVTGAVTQTNQYYNVPVNRINGTWDYDIKFEDAVFWFGFHQAAGSGGGNVSRERQTLTVTTNNIDLDWDGSNDLISSNRVAVSAGVTITYLNSTSADFSTFKVEITNSATLTFPSGTVSGDANWSSLVWTPPSNGKFTVSIYRTGTEYEAIFTQSEAV